MAVFYYPSFNVAIIYTDGYRYSVAGNVNVYNVTQDTSLGTLTADSEGIVPEGSFSDSVAALYDIIEISHATYTKTARFVLQETQDLAYLAAENDVMTYIAEDDYSAKSEPSLLELMIVDKNVPDAQHINFGAVAVGKTTKIPYKATKNQNLRIYGAPSNNDFQATASDLTQLPFADVDISIDSVPTPIFDEITDTATATVASETLYDQAIPANTLTHNGDAVKYEAAGTFAANANTKAVWVEVAGTVIGESTPGAYNGVDWAIDGVAIREDSDTLKFIIELTIDGTSPIIRTGKINSLNFAADIDFLLRGRTPTQAGDLTAYFWKAYKIPAADIVPPGVPGNFTGTAQDSASILWEWTAATDV